MKRKRQREYLKRQSPRFSAVELLESREKSVDARDWVGERCQYLTVIGVVLITLCTVIIYGQTVLVPPIDYEDSYYLVHSPYVQVRFSFAGLGRVWSEPYFANFHPVTTTTWLIDRAFADKSKPFDAVPFRIANLAYAAVGASLLILLYRRLGIPRIIAVLGAVI